MLGIEKIKNPSYKRQAASNKRQAGTLTSQKIYSIG